MFSDVCQSGVRLPADVQGWDRAEPERFQQFDQVGRIHAVVHHQHMDLPGMNPDYANRIVGIAGHQHAVIVLLKTLHEGGYAIVISNNEDSWKPWQFGPLGHRTLFRSIPAATSVGLAQTGPLWDLNCFSLWPSQVNCLETIRLRVRLSFRLHAIRRIIRSEFKLWLLRWSEEPTKPRSAFRRAARVGPLVMILPAIDYSGVGAYPQVPCHAKSGSGS